MASVDTSSATATPGAVFPAGADRKGSTADDDGAGFRSVFQNATDKSGAKAAKPDRDAAKTAHSKSDQALVEQSLHADDAQSADATETAADPAASSRIKIANTVVTTGALRPSLQNQLAQLPQQAQKAEVPVEESVQDGRIVSDAEMQDKKDTQVQVQLSVATALSKQGRPAATQSEADDSKPLSHTATTKSRTTSIETGDAETTTEPSDLKTLIALLDNAATAGALATQSAATSSTKSQQTAASVHPQARGDVDPQVDLKLSLPLHGPAADDIAADDTAPAATDITDPGIDTVFRLTRADGKGGTLNMVVSDKKAGTDETAVAAPNAKVENVSVLDARRFLAFGNPENSGAVTQAISQDKDWSAALSSRSLTGDTAMNEATSKVVNTLKIQMHPLDLGQVTATMHLRNDELTVSLRVQTGEAYRQLNQDQDRMIDALRSQGYAVDQITVQLVTNDQQDTQSQSSGQQSRGDTGSFQNQGREQQDNSARRQAASGAWQRDEQTTSSAGTGTADPSRAGDVYI